MYVRAQTAVANRLASKAKSDERAPLEPEPGNVALHADESLYDSMNGTIGDFDQSAKNRTWRTLAWMSGVVLLFAAGVLQFATLKYRHWPPEQRVNNGPTPTFFAFHIGPSYNFSEDFHLYYVRAKRIARRGWTNGLFYSQPNEQANYAAPLQVALGRLALLTEGRPRRFSLFMFGVLAAGWTTLVISARRWLPDEISSASILLAVMVTLLFEALHLAVSDPPFNSFGQWPTFRALRMSTMGWTSPLLLAVMIGLVSLVYNRRRWLGALSSLAVMLVALLGADNWAFAIGWGAAGLAALWIACQAAMQKRRSGQWPPAAFAVCAGLAIVIAATYWGHQQLNSSLTGDALLRGGFGTEWINAAEREGNVEPMRKWITHFALVPLIAVMLLSFVEPRSVRTEKKPILSLEPRTWAWLRAIAILPVISILVLNFVLSQDGMECFLRNQLYWRADYCLLFVLTLVAAEWLRTSLPAFSFQHARAWPLVVGVLLGALFIYHNYRIHWFVSNVAARDFFLTADAEGMRPWLKKFDREHERYELATASLELNYLCAFWTNADLLLPSGFPYHDASSNAEIHDRAVQLLRLYGANEESWLRFTRPTGERFTDLWLKSRAAASGRGFAYHLFHRWNYFVPSDNTAWTERGRLSIGRALSQATTTRFSPEPEIILVDDVSRQLGQPNLSNYTLGYRHGGIEAWVRNDVPFSSL